MANTIQLMSACVGGILFICLFPRNKQQVNKFVWREWHHKSKVDTNYFAYSWFSLFVIHKK